MPAPKEIIELVERFSRNIEEYKELNYKEARVRQDFINPFFRLLGWDINNYEGLPEDAREVVVEDSIEIQGNQKAPDYCFRVKGDRIFFVEAKKPGVNIKESIDPAYQIRRYGYTAKLPVSILTDFEEFAVYDTRIKPNKKDGSRKALLFYCKYEEYAEKFDEIYKLFAKENVQKGSIKDYLGTKLPKGAYEVDKEFLKMIEDWRSLLAKNIAINNLKLEIDQLNLAIQKIIDRILFLRIAEDRGIENSETLLNVTKEKRIYPALVLCFERANKKYNSELFKNDTAIDSLTIENKVLEEIITGIYYPDCPYALAVLPIEMLGNIYEQFLGKTIRLTESHQAKVEEKPEVRKAGGVYYTPKYIVDYIVKNTVGEKIKGATPKEIEQLKILDPACGSGSFLLGAYNCLMAHHLAYYTKPSNRAKALKDERIWQAAKDTYRLTIKEKQKILLNNIFGVDIDAQAVEVTKLSLMLKLLEGEGDESAGKLFKYSQVKLLPNLSGNIKCGNSLIGPDFYKDKNLSLFGNEEMKKINTFDWDSKEKGFGEIMENGGFDCVIGNPPYVDSELMTKEYPEQRQYITDKYVVAKGNWDLYIPFFELGIKVLNKKGMIGLITPNKWLTIPYAEELRKYLAKRIALLTNCSKIKVFKAGNNPLITFSENRLLSGPITVESYQTDLSIVQSAKVKRDLLPGNDWGFLLANNIPLINKLKTIPNKVADSCIVESPFTVSEAYDLIRHIRDNKNADSKNYFKFINTGTIDRYVSLWGIKTTTYIKKKYQFPVVGKHDFEDLFPKRNNQTNRSKIIISGMRHFECFHDKNGEYVAGKSTVIITHVNSITFVALCAILNSKLITYYLKEMYSSSGIDGGISFTPGMIRNLPIPKQSKEFEQKVSKLVNQMLETQKRFHSAKSESDKKHYQQKIEILDKQIDRLVYELYGLTKEEMKVIEGKDK